MKLPLRQAGFTIVELMISIGVFSVILVLCSATLITVGRQYQKASISSTTQNVARTIMDDVSGQVKLSANAPVLITSDLGPDASANTGDETKVICIGAIRYAYMIGWQLESNINNSKHQNNHVLWKDLLTNQSNCTVPDLRIANPSGASGTNGKELMSVHTRLTAFNISTVRENLVNLDVAVIYGDDDVLDNLLAFPGSIVGCLDEKAGGAFCAVSELHTTVIRRLQ